MKKKIIEIKNLTKTFKLSEDVQVHALKGVSIKVHKGEFIAIMGSSGSGKSTFMTVLGFLDTPTSGEYFLDGVDGVKLNSNQKAEIRNQKIGFVSYLCFIGDIFHLRN